MRAQDKKLHRFQFSLMLTDGKQDPWSKKYPKHVPQIYLNVFKHVQNIYKVLGGGQAAAARPVPEPPGPDRGPRLGAGPGCRRLTAAWYSVHIFYILYVFVYVWIYLAIFLY